MKNRNNTPLVLITIAVSMMGWPNTALSSDDLDDILNQYRNKYNLPALGAIVVKNGMTVGIGAVGHRKNGSEKEIGRSDKWHIGSCSKAMTATLVAKLIERGVLNWETTIQEVFPKLKMRQEYRNVTIKELLTHRAGLPSEFTIPELWAKLWENYDSPPIEQRLFLMKRLLNRPAVHTPGTEYLYSNSGYTIAAAMVEKLTGQSWEELMIKEIFTPLDMKSAGFGPPRQTNPGSEPVGHNNEGVPVESGHSADNPSAIAPGGKIHCTLMDWAKFINIHLMGARGKSNLLKAQSFKILHTPPEGQEYALGWIRTEREWADGWVLTHSGSNNLWFAVVWIAPKKDLAVMVVSNMGGDRAKVGCDATAWELIQKYVD